jgi:2-polyprenyl-3-methyl-5-hydroxy-6-metoxy-1,4-benzoquinol methylase
MAHDINRYDSKTSMIFEAVRGRSVLHLGAVGETMCDTDAKVAAAPRSTHAAITAAADHCVGIDYDSDAVAAIAAAGVFDNIIAGDVYDMERTDIPLDSIDAIVAGDIIEHLTDPGRLLRSLVRFVAPGGVLIVTVPNAAGLPQFLRYALGKPIEGLDHRCSFNTYTLTRMLESTGWSVDNVDACHQALADDGGAVFRAGRAFFRRVPHLGGTLIAIATVAT